MFHLSSRFNIDPFIGSTMPMSARLMGSLPIRTLMERLMENNTSHWQRESHRGRGTILLSRVWGTCNSRQLDASKLAGQHI